MWVMADSRNDSLTTLSIHNVVAYLPSAAIHNISAIIAHCCSLSLVSSGKNTSCYGHLYDARFDLLVYVIRQLGSLDRGKRKARLDGDGKNRRALNAPVLRLAGARIDHTVIQFTDLRRNLRFRRTLGESRRKVRERHHDRRGERRQTRAKRLRKPH